MKKVLVAVVCFTLLYSVFILFQQQMVRGLIHPVHLAFLSYSLATVFLWALVRIPSKKLPKFRPKKNISYAIIAGILSAVIADTLVMFGLQQSSAINWVIFSQLIAFVTYILAVIFLAEPKHWKKLMAIGISFLGIILIVGSTNGSFTINPGDLLFIGAVIAFALGNLSSQKALTTLSVFEYSVIRVTTGALILGVITWLFFPIDTVTTWPFLVANATALIIGIGLIGYIIQQTSSSFLSLSFGIIPVITMALSSLIYHHPPTLVQIVGASLVILAVFVFQKQASRDRSLVSTTS